MSDFDLEHIYSLYNPDDGVVLYECINEAERAKRRLEKLVPVNGPFQHSRAERGLIVAALRALKIIAEISKENPSIAEEGQLGELASELQSALNILINPTQSS